MRQHLVFADQGGGGHLRHHEAGVQAGAGSEKRGQTFAERGIHHALETPFADAGQRAQRNCEEVEGEGERLAVKVAARDHVAVSSFDLGFHEDERIVDGGVGFGLKHRAAVGERVAHGAMHLRHAAQ